MWWTKLYWRWLRWMWRDSIIYERPWTSKDTIKYILFKNLKHFISEPLKRFWWKRKCYFLVRWPDTICRRAILSFFQWDQLSTMGLFRQRRKSVNIDNDYDFISYWCILLRKRLLKFFTGTFQNKSFDAQSWSRLKGLGWSIQCTRLLV